MVVERAQVIPGEIFTDGPDLELNAGRRTLELVVENGGDRPIQVGSHYHFAETNGALKFDNELTNWSLVEVLMSDKFSREVALGIHDDGRMKADYELVRDYVGIDKPFDVKSVYTNEFLDRSIRMTK